MKNINTESDEFANFLNPVLTSDASDFLHLRGEKRLRLLASTIPSYGHHQLESVTQGCISATIHATQEFLSEVVSGLSLTNPRAARTLTVSSSGLDALDWLNRTKDSQHGWIPNYPVAGYITSGMLASAPRFGMAPLEPAITLDISRSNEEGDDFLVQFSVADAEDMRHLAMLMADAGGLWNDFEDIFGVTPFTSIPLPESVGCEPDKKWTCRAYADAFVEHIVSKADDEDCLETFNLEFAIEKSAPLHQPIVAAISLLDAFSLYHLSIQTMDRDKTHSKALEELKSAIRTGTATKQFATQGK